MWRQRFLALSRHSHFVDLQSRSPGTVGGLSTPDRPPYHHLTTILSYLQRQVEHMRSHMRAPLIELTTTRRQFNLALPDWDPEFKRDLLHQPWSTSDLFNGQVSPLSFSLHPGRHCPQGPGYGITASLRPAMTQHSPAPGQSFALIFWGRGRGKGKSSGSY